MTVILRLTSWPMAKRLKLLGTYLGGSGDLLSQWLNGLNFWGFHNLVGKISRSNFVFSGSRTAK